MSNEKLPDALNTDDSSDQPNRSTTSTVVTRRNQQVITQQIVTSRKVIKNSSNSDQSTIVPIMDLGSSPVIESSVVTGPDGNPKTIRKTTTTYRRRIIRRIGPNGETTEEVIEEGNPICGEMLSLPQTGFQRDSNPLSITNISNENLHKTSVAGAANFQVMAAFKSISDTGEEQSANFSTGPIQAQFREINPNMLTNDDNGSSNDDSKRLSALSNSGDTVQEVLPDGSTITRKFFTSKTATVTQTKTINGETKTSSKSAFMCYSGESMLQADSTMNDMEDLFKEMTAQLKLEGFDVLNRFMLSADNNVTDHMALAGGDSGSSLLAIEGPETNAEPQETSHSRFKMIKKPFGTRKPNEITLEHPIPVVKSLESIKKVEEQQQEEVRQKIIAIKEQKLSNRLYWSTMDEVKASGVMKTMRKEEIDLQEGIFEIITSEASYNISLDIVIEFYYKSDLLNPNREGSIINSVEKHHLFSNILLVKGVSLQFLKDLESHWSQNKPRIVDLAHIILKHAKDKEFEQQYVNYLANQPYQINALKSLLQRESFRSALESIQCNPKCCKLSLDSFLALPMQRLTRLKLLLDVVLKLMNQSRELLNSIPIEVLSNHQKALSKVKELLDKSGDKKFEMEQKERLMDLSKILEFGTGCKNVAIGSKVLIKEGELKAHSRQISSVAYRKLSKKKLPIFYLIVLNDLVIITKKKSVTKFVVLDYCERQLVEAIVDTTPNVPVPTHKISRERINGSQVPVPSVSPKESSDNTAQIDLGHSFILKFGKSESDSLTEPLVLEATSRYDRDQWICAIMSK